jgi:hypothetical protein
LISENGDGSGISCVSATPDGHPDAQVENNVEQHDPSQAIEYKTPAMEIIDRRRSLYKMGAQVQRGGLQM